MSLSYLQVPKPQIIRDSEHNVSTALYFRAIDDGRGREE